MPCRIEDYALIGDCETAALVGRDGSVDWLCWPRFDSDACFTALLGSPEHGRWLIAPQDASARVTRRYRGDTLILETRFETNEGVVLLIDFMPPRSEHSKLIRVIVGESGHVEMQTEFVMRFGYGALVPWVHRLEDGSLCAIAGPDQVVLCSPVPVHGEGAKTVGTAKAGDTLSFVLTYAFSHLPPPAAVDPIDSLREAERFWLEWSGRAHIEAGERRGL
jgi:GH15 family glucan-1,4-alpha-glucosidase